MRCYLILALGGIEDFFEEGTIIEVLPEGTVLAPGTVTMFKPILIETSKWTFRELRTFIKFKVIDFARIGVTENDKLRRRLQRSNVLQVQAAGMVIAADYITEPVPKIAVNIDAALMDAKNAKQIPAIVMVDLDEPAKPGVK